MSIAERRLSLAETLDEAVVIIPFSFTSAGAGVPTNVQGGEVAGRLVTRVSPGLFTFALADKPFAVIACPANVSGGAAEDIVVQVDYSAATSTGVITVRTKTGAVATDPASGDVVSGCLIVSKTDRRMSL